MSDVSNTPSRHPIRDSYYYGGYLNLVRHPDYLDETSASLEWEAYEGGTVSLRLDYWELGRLAKACEALRTEMRSGPDMEWLDRG